jgi:hypothetical protein
LVEPDHMSVQTYSRDYLQAVPQQKKKEQMDKIVQEIIGDIHTAAAAGGTSYRYVRESSALTDAEIVAGFFERFPGCKVYYEEAVDHTKRLKKGIVIDWE